MVDVAIEYLQSDRKCQFNIISPNVKEVGMWEIAWAKLGTEELARYLKEGWEPFAASCLGNPDYALIWLRKKFA